MIWSDKAIDYSAGFDKQDNGTAKPRKIGTNVMTTEEAREILIKRFGWG